MNFAESLALTISNLSKTLSEKEVLDKAWTLSVAEIGNKRSTYYFCYDEDFSSDLVSTYFHLVKENNV